MIRLRKLEFVATGAAILLLAIVAAVFYSNRPDVEQTIVETGPEANETADNGNGEAERAAPIPTQRATVAPTPTPALTERTILWTTALPGGSGTQSANGIAYETNAEQGRLFVANGEQGVQLFSAAGEPLGTMTIIDPATEQPAFVHDVAWSPLLWLAPPEYGLVALTEPFETGEYLHIIDVDTGAILSSFTHNSNIAIPATTPLVDEALPTHLAASSNGELFVDRLFTFAPLAEDTPAINFNYLLRLRLDGRVLNPAIVNEGLVDEEDPSVVEALAYQEVTDKLYAAVDRYFFGSIQKFTLTGSAQRLAVLEDDLFRWQTNVALSADERGRLFIAIDEPGHIVELDQNDEIVNVYGFQNKAGEVGYPEFDLWFPGDMGLPLAMAVMPGRSMIFIVDQRTDGIYLTAYLFPLSSA